MAYHALKCPKSTGSNLGKSGQAWRFSFSICTIPVCHECRAPAELPCHAQWLVRIPFLPLGLPRRRGEAGWLPYLLARHSSSAIQQPTSVICAMSASFPSSLFPAAESNAVSHLDEDHLFKRTKYNLEYMKYGQHKYSLLYLTVFCFLTLAYSRCFKEISPCCCLQTTVHSVARRLERGHM